MNLEDPYQVIVFADSRSGAKDLVSDTGWTPGGARRVKRDDAKKVIRSLFPNLITIFPNGHYEFTFTPSDLKLDHFFLTACDIVIRGWFNIESDVWWHDVDYDGPRIWRVKIS
tara:strand:- start:809 stop:1147 length:339 start_codon:yes stop_codon:yes gene_type:complete